MESSNNAFGQEPYESMSNFTPRAQQVLALARKEADRFHHNFVGTEHLLLGLIHLGQGTAVTVLGRQGVNLEAARKEVEKAIGTGPEQQIFGNIPYTPRVKKVLALAVNEAKTLQHTYVGTERLLLGLLREDEGVAGRVLRNLGVNIDKTRVEILKELDPGFANRVGNAETHPSRTSATPEVLDQPRQPESPTPVRDQIDTTKRYDVYCVERNQELVVYRNVLFKSTKYLFPRPQQGILAEFVELEHADSRLVFVARTSIIKFCEPGATPGPEPVPGKKP